MSFTGGGDERRLRDTAQRRGGDVWEGRCCGGGGCCSCSCGCGCGCWPLGRPTPATHVCDKGRFAVERQFCRKVAKVVATVHRPVLTAQHASQLTLPACVEAREDEAEGKENVSMRPERMS